MGLKEGSICRTFESRTELYRLVLEMRRKGKSYRDIQKQILVKTGTHLSKSSISYWTRGIHEPSGSLNSFKAEPSPELSYVIGVALGDGNTNVHEYHREILLSVTDQDFAQEFAKCLGMVLNKHDPYKVRWREEEKMGGARVERSSPRLSEFELGDTKQSDRAL